jgi:hypothetical protein
MRCRASTGRGRWRFGACRAVGLTARTGWARPQLGSRAHTESRRGGGCSRGRLCTSYGKRTWAGRKPRPKGSSSDTSMSWRRSSAFVQAQVPRVEAPSWLALAPYCAKLGKWKSQPVSFFGLCGAADPRFNSRTGLAIWATRSRTGSGCRRPAGWPWLPGVRGDLDRQSFEFDTNAMRLLSGDQPGVFIEPWPP